MKLSPIQLAKTILLRSDVFTYQDLAKMLKVSNKTVRNKIKETELLFKNFNIKLLKIRGIGLKIKANTIDINNCFEYLEKNNNHTYYTSEIRKNIIIYFLLIENKKITISYLEKSLFITRVSIYNDLNQLKQYFSNFKIELRKDKYNGLYLFGGEKRMRKCILYWLHNFSAQDIQHYLNFPQIISFYKQIFKESQKHKELKNALTDLENSLNIKFKKEEVSKIIMIFLISVDRIKKEKHISFEKPVTKTKLLIKINLYFQKQRLVFNNIFKLNIPDNEYLYIGSLLSSNTLSQHTEIKNDEIKKVISKYLRYLKDHSILVTNLRNSLNNFLLSLYHQALYDSDIFDQKDYQLNQIYPKFYTYASYLNSILSQSKLPLLNKHNLDLLTMILLKENISFQTKLKGLYLRQKNIFNDLNIEILKAQIPNLDIIENVSLNDYLINDIDFIISEFELSETRLPIFKLNTLIDDDYLAFLKNQLKTLRAKKLVRL